MVHWILSGGAAVHGGNLISLERAREASSRAVSAHLSGGGGCSLGSGLAKHHCRLGRTQLSRRRRLGQCVGCSSWSRSSCVHHSALYRSCVPDRCKIYVSSCLCIVARSIGKIVTMRHKIFKHFWHAAPRPSRTLLGWHPCCAKTAIQRAALVTMRLLRMVATGITRGADVSNARTTCHELDGPC